jgi:LysM repeat protein
MLKLKFLLVLLIFSAHVIAQKKDSLFVSYENSRMVIHHAVQSGETILSLAKRYHAPAAVVADINGMTYQDGMEKKKKLFIPIGPYNYITAKPSNTSKSKPLFYKVTAKDNLYRLSKQAGLQQQTLQQWNNLPDNAITPGQTLHIGWVDYTIEESPVTSIKTPPVPAKNGKVETQVYIIKRPDTSKPVSVAEKTYLTQTNNEQHIVEEKGTAVFFTSAGKVSSSTTFFAFHNSAPKGAVIKVYNPGTEKTVFVKVLGPIPETKQYHNAIIGIGSGAKEALGVAHDRAWCELKYAGY